MSEVPLYPNRFHNRQAGGMGSLQEISEAVPIPTAPPILTDVMPIHIS